MDSQQVEIVGRNVLVSALVADGLEVAQPLRDRGIDLIAYDDRDGFKAVPLQLKAATTSAFSLDRKYERIPGLFIVFVWNVQQPPDASAFCLSYPESLGVAEELGWTATASWIEKGKYSNTRPGERVQAHLERFRMREGSWRERLGLLTTR